jgi:hypothetical protein
VTEKLRVPAEPENDEAQNMIDAEAVTPPDAVDAFDAAPATAIDVVKPPAAPSIVVLSAVPAIE